MTIFTITRSYCRVNLAEWAEGGNSKRATGFSTLATNPGFFGDLGPSYKSAFVLLHKPLEAMAKEMKGRIVGGEGKTAAISAAASSPPMSKHIAVIGALPGTRAASGKLS